MKRVIRHMILSASRAIPDKLYLQLLYYKNFGKFIDLESPKTFNEKIQWLKLNDRNPSYTMMVDKYAVKEYVSKKIGSEYVIPTLGVWNSAEDIDFNTLPNQFVLKCNNDSGGIVICKDKNLLDITATINFLTKRLKSNGYWYGREWPYKNVKPCILAEVYIEDSKFNELRDYKFFTFNGVVKALFIATERQNKSVDTKFDFFDSNFQHLPLTNGHPNALTVPEKPESFNEMKRLAEMLAKGIPHLRVDFYEVDGKVYFGEMTFAHFSGVVPFNPPEWDMVFGNWLTLPNKS